MMKNLSFYNYKSVFYKDSIKNQITATNANGEIYAITIDPISKLLSVCHYKENEELKYHCISDVDDVISELVYLQFEQKLFLALRTEIILIDLGLKDDKHISLPDDLLAVKWNKTQDMLACYHSNGTVACYALNFEILELIMLETGHIDDKPEESVYVGWGSSKTQFQGLKKKAAANTPSEQEFKCTKETPIIDWRGNSEHFVINYFKDGERKINVYDRNCDLLHTSNKGVSGFLPPTAFRPAGNTIACITSRKGNDRNVTFIEKNCELIDTFPLQENVEVLDIKWSPCGEYIGIYQKFEKSAWVDLFLYTHATWSLKQRLPIRSNKLIEFRFVEALQNMICIELFLEDGSYRYTYTKHIYKNDDVICSVKGLELLIWFYKDAISPPDAYEADYKIQIKNPINSIVFGNSTKLALIDCLNIAYIYDYDERTLNETIHLPVVELQAPITHYRFCFDSFGDFMSISIGRIEDHKFSLKSGKALEQSSEKNVIYANQGILLSSSISKLPLTSIILYEVEKIPYKFFLTALGTLIVNGVEIGIGFTSMHLHDNFLMLTMNKTLNQQYGNTLISFELTQEKLTKLLISKNIFNLSYTRIIEQGAIISHSIKSTSILILLLPRGNYEVIELRNISMQKLKNLLDNHLYKEAYDIIKFQSMGINLLIDLNPYEFLNNLETVYTQLNDPFVFNKLLIELQDDLTLDQEDLKVVQVKILPDKRKQVCSALYNFFMKFENIHEVLPTLSLVLLFNQSNQFNTEGALEIISLVSKGKFTEYLSYINSAIECISSYVSYEEMYTKSLAINNLELAKIVADKSNLDPKIYNGFLDKLSNSDELTKRYLIAIYVGDNEYEALFNLERFREKQITLEELINFIKRTKSVSKIFDNIGENDGELYAVISKMYVEELKQRFRFKEAGLVLAKAGFLEEAISLLIKNLYWKEALMVIYKVEEKEGYLNDLARTLQNGGLLNEAANVYINHCNDHKNGLICLLDARNYLEAYNVCLKVEDGNFTDKFLLPSLISYIQETDMKILELTVKFIKMYNRYLVVRDERSKHTEMRLENDLYTDTDSVISRTTISRSTATSKASRRLKKEERKYTNLKEGSKYEDIALLMELHKTITEVFNIGAAFKEIFDFLNMIYKTRDNEHVVVLVNRIQDVQQFMLDVSDNIWPPEIGHKSEDKENEYVNENMVHLNVKYRAKPENMKKLDVILF